MKWVAVEVTAGRAENGNYNKTLRRWGQEKNGVHVLGRGREDGGQHSRRKVTRLTGLCGGVEL